MDLMEEVRSMSDSDVDEALSAEANSKVAPKGTWEGVILSWNRIENLSDTDKVKFGENADVYKVGVTLYDCPEYGQTRTAWVKITPEKVKNAAGNYVANYLSMAGLINATDTRNQSTVDTLEQGKVTRCRYRIEQWFKNDDTERKFPQGNWVKSIGKL